MHLCPCPGIDVWSLGVGFFSAMIVREIILGISAAKRFINENYGDK